MAEERETKTEMQVVKAEKKQTKTGKKEVKVGSNDKKRRGSLDLNERLAKKTQVEKEEVVEDA